MSVIRLTWACITAGFVLAMLAGLTLTLGVARDRLADDVTQAGAAAARSLVHGAQTADALRAVAAERSTAERWAALAISDARGHLQLALADAAPSGRAPAWFAKAVRLDLKPMVAIGRSVQGADAAGAPFAVAVIARTDRAYELLWTLSWAIVVAIALAGAGVIVALSQVLRWARRPLEGFGEQIRALSESRLVSMTQPAVTEWIDLSKALNVMVARVGLMLDEKEARLDSMKHEMEQDALTGVASRNLLMARLRHELASEDSERSGAVVIVRMHDLVGMNQRAGRERTDDFLRAVATALRPRVYPFEAHGGMLARLNGSDFCILLPGVSETALQPFLASTSSALAALHVDRIAESWNVGWIGASTYRHGESLSDVMTRADAMVMASETRRERHCMTTAAEPLHLITVAQWRVMIEDALETGRVQLAYFPVLGRDGELLHREAMLRLQGPDGALLPALAFIPPAIRTGRVLELDLRAVELALLEIDRSGSDVAVNVAAHSLRRPIFVRRVCDLLQRSGAASARLWLEVDEVGLSESPDELLHFTQALLPFGCKVGIEHFGHHFAALTRRHGLGLHYVKLDRAFCIGVHERLGLQAFVRTVIETNAQLGITVIGEGLVDARDLQTLQRLGVGGATGPLVSKALVEAGSRTGRGSA